ncbi:ATP-binding response regulator [Pseudobacteriovorax antillogorgiicola]|uniref:Response regulator receiver domain-containing protein n=1 Tax=Pseudobacteriovorax antillogorgiicola TaxID=1513793 RepID=A0A1Y6BVI2_9BACT|nr:response regulator [Pseudobacteriovorax antillogorgiicola]TCS52281.1 response regulator receiver domain-containing protein [Pseudobacteriovorax antillogorgiicola]SMF30692.1 Response regulator receiver domain-containing protein [Pseudobacteriovorax antillogorgiicola]
MKDLLESQIVDFSSILSFELRSSLNVILNGINLLIEEQHAQVKDNLSTISMVKASAENLLALTNLLTLLKPRDDFHYEDIDLPSFASSIKNIMGPSIEEKRINFSISAQDKVIRFEKQMLHTILISLLSSRIKACSKECSLECKIALAEDGIVIQTKDNGRMLSNLGIIDSSGSLFRNQSKTYNIGELEILLAASLIRRIYASMEALQSSSELHLTVKIPLSLNDTEDPSNSDFRYLIVDDDPDLVSYTKMILEALRPGAHIKTASNGTDAVKVLETFEPDFIFTDLIMPNGDGFDLIRNISGKGIKIIAISGLGDEGVRQRVESVLGITYLEKPFTFECVRKIIEKE